VRSDYFIVDVNFVQLVRLADMLRRKEIQTSVGSVLPLVEARAAHQMLGGMLPRKLGKIVLQVASLEASICCPSFPQAISRRGCCASTRRLPGR
jgi:hypothetical protein